jgi:two-component system, LytTR family, response regulator
MYTVILIDDEKYSTEVLEWQINKYCPSLKIVAICNSPDEGIAAIKEHGPDLVFLDIEMPRMTGFEMLEQLNPLTFEVIFTTAYDEFAVKAFQVSALDYLLKPVDINELKRAVEKFELTVKKNTRQDIPSAPSSSSPVAPRSVSKKRVALTTNESLIFMETENIIYCESNSNYTYFHLDTADKKILVSKTLKDIEQILINYDFFRIHNSYLVNMKHIKEFLRGSGGHIVMSNGDHLTVSRTKKEEFFEMFSKF